MNFISFFAINIAVLLSISTTTEGFAVGMGTGIGKRNIAEVFVSIYFLLKL